MRIDKTKIYGFESAFRGMRNPLNSWSLSDSYCNYDNDNIENWVIGEKDLNLAQRLIKAGTEHCKFMRQIQVWADFDMTRYFWSEMDTYKFNSKNSCSTMHKLLNPKNEITKEMFEYYKEDEDVVQVVIDRLNMIRKLFLESNNKEKRVLKRRAKTLLFEGFLQLRTINTNYAELRNIIIQRRNHQLKEDWQDAFCKWATTLSYAKELIFCGIEEDFERLV
ncbi:hypothetical protein [Clostridium sp. VAP52]|uniref:hypothetical protein n=1 Tax=Clostridium sp. VAP52 TaxID=2949977 RepID=UPI00207A9C38|nr:hypothetical protein [Clostridium sp. VAP52]